MSEHTSMSAKMDIIIAEMDRRRQVMNNIQQEVLSQRPVQPTLSSFKEGIQRQADRLEHFKTLKTELLKPIDTSEITSNEFRLNTIEFLEIIETGFDKLLAAQQKYLDDLLELYPQAVALEKKRQELLA